MSARPSGAVRGAWRPAAALAVVLAAGCSSVPIEPTAPEPLPEPPVQAVPVEPVEPTVRPAPPAKPAVRKPSAPAPTARRRPRGGAYYRDDGPGDDPPPNLASIPDAVPRAEPLHPVANRPYRVFGRAYVPRLDLAPNHRERGHASWYGRKFHGRPTSSGERYDMYGMTAAHPTLPIPSYVRVTNLGNGRSVVVRVNDRGPFLKRRVIDLTYTAAHKLGYAHDGSTEVEVELLTPPAGAPRPVQTAVRADVAAAAGPSETDGPAEGTASTLPTPMLAEAAAERLSLETTIDEQPPTVALAVLSRTVATTGADTPAADDRAGTGVADVSDAAANWLQFGAFVSRGNAEAARARVRRDLPWLGVPVEIVAHGALWRVQAGPWSDRDDALEAAGRIAADGAHRPFVVERR